MKKAFTLIEMLVSLSIVLLISAAAFLSMGQAEDSTLVSSGTGEVKSLLEELQSYAAGPERGRAYHYVLIIKNDSSTTSYCNQGLAPNYNTNRLTKKNQYIICSAQKQDLSSVDLNLGLQRVRAGRFDADITITQPTDNPIIFNSRSYDGLLGYNQKYIDTGLNPTTEKEKTITVTKGEFTKDIVINFIVNTISEK